MSWFKSIFTGTASNATMEKEKELLGENAASPEEIVQTLRLKRMQQLQQSKKLETQAKTALNNGDRRTAAALLKQKTVIDTRLRQLDGQIANMEQQKLAYESAALSAQMARSMRSGTKDMQVLVSAVDVDDIHEVADELADLSEQSFQMSDALAAPLGASYMPYDVDDQITRQLDEWQAKPEVPVQTPPVVNRDDKEEDMDPDILARLERLQVSAPPAEKVTSNN